MSNQPSNEQEACKVRRYELSSAELPLCCPMPNQLVWNAHPRVYLPIEATGKIICPYCGIEYILKKDNA